MSGSGNMIPQSISRIRSSTSMQAQLRPISPRPPRKTIRTGLVTPSEGSRALGGASPPEDPPKSKPHRSSGRGRRDDDAVAPPDPPPALGLVPDPADHAASGGYQLQRPPDEAEQRGGGQEPGG